MSFLINRKLTYAKQSLYVQAANRPPKADEDMNKTWSEYVSQGINRRKAAIYDVSTSQSDVTSFMNMSCTTIAVLAELYFCTIPFPPTLNVLDEMLGEIIRTGTVIWMIQMREKLLHNALINCANTAPVLSKKAEDLQKPIRLIIKEIIETDFDNPTPSVKSFLENGFMSCDEALQSVPFRYISDPSETILTHHGTSLPLYACEKLEYYSFKLKEIGLYVNLLKYYPTSYLYKMINNGYQEVLELVENVQQNKLPIEYLNDIPEIGESNIALKMLMNDTDEYKQRRDMLRKEIYSFNGVCAKRMCSEIMNQNLDVSNNIKIIVQYLETSIEHTYKDITKYGLYFNALLTLLCSSALQHIYLLTDEQKKDFAQLPPWILIQRLAPKMNIDHFKERVEIAKTSLPHGLEFENPKYGTVSFKSLGRIMKEIASTNTICQNISKILQSDTELEQQCMFHGPMLAREFDRMAEERNALHCGAVITTKYQRSFLVHCKLHPSSCTYYIFDSHAVSLRGTAVFITVHTEDLLYRTLTDLLKPDLIDIYTVDFLVWNNSMDSILNNSFMKQLVNKTKFETMINLLEHDTVPKPSATRR